MQHCRGCSCGIVFARRGVAWHQPTLAGYDTKLSLVLRCVSYQAANQSSCHNGADVAAVTAAAATTTVAAFDTVVEFSSGLLPDGPRLLFGGGARVPPRVVPGSLRQIFTNNNRQPPSLVTTKRCGALLPRGEDFTTEKEEMEQGERERKRKR